MQLLVARNFFADSGYKILVTKDLYLWAGPENILTIRLTSQNPLPKIFTETWS
jgi:hypothetical protein